jgi:hypothetical protein
MPGSRRQEGTKECSARTANFGAVTRFVRLTVQRDPAHGLLPDDVLPRGHQLKVHAPGLQPLQSLKGPRDGWKVLGGWAGEMGSPRWPQSGCGVSDSLVRNAHLEVTGIKEGQHLLIGFLPGPPPDMDEVIGAEIVDLNEAPHTHRAHARQFRVMFASGRTVNSVP